MNWRLLNYDRFTGTKTWWAWDSENLRNVIRYEFADIDLDYHKTLRNDTEYSKEGVKGDNALHYANIPCSVLTHWATLGVDINDTHELFRMVNRPEWKYLKTTDLSHA